jgi:hypothetical protein
MPEFTEGQLAIIRQTAFEVGDEFERRVTAAFAASMRLHRAECTGPADAVVLVKKAFGDDMTRHVNECPMRAKSFLAFVGLFSMVGGAIVWSALALWKYFKL